MQGYLLRHFLKPFAVEEGCRLGCRHSAIVALQPSQGEGAEEHSTEGSRGGGAAGGRACAPYPAAGPISLYAKSMTSTSLGCGLPAAPWHETLKGIENVTVACTEDTGTV